MPRLAIRGGGQLAKLTTTAAAKFGCEIVVFERHEDFTAHSLDTHSLIYDWSDPKEFLKLAAPADVETLEQYRLLGLAPSTCRTGLCAFTISVADLYNAPLLFSVLRVARAFEISDDRQSC